VTEIRATYYDGESSRGHDVVVRLDDTDRLCVEAVAGNADPTRLPPELPLELDLKQVRISPRLGNTVRSIAFPSGAKCESTDNDALDQLQARTGTGRGLALVHLLETHWQGAVAAVVVLAVVAVVGFTWGVPALARQVAMRVPDALAYDLGKGTLSTLDKTLFHSSTLPPQRQEELQSRFTELSQHFAGLPLHLELRSGAANAFALPDGTVVMTDELVELAENDDEIVGVLAHEVGHVQGRHAMRMALESSAVGLFAFAYFGDASQLSTILGAMPAMLANSHYSQAHETEADDFAMQYLDSVHVSPAHLAAILQRLGEHHDTDDSGPNYLSSHPPTAERVQRLTGQRR